MIVTINGKPGSGKTTIANRLAEALGVPQYYIGGMRRKMAEDRGMTLEEFNRLGEREAWTDRDVDEYQRKLGETEKDFVIQGRTSWYFIPHSVKIFLDVSVEEGTRRVFSSIQKGERVPEAAGATSLEDVAPMLERRVASDVRRYQKYYGIENIYDTKPYDLVVNTTDKTPDEVFQQVLKFVREKTEK